MRKEKVTLPKNMTKEATDFIDGVLAILKEKGILEKAMDSGALYMLASNYDTFIKAQQRVDSEGMTVTSDRGNIAVHPCIKIARDAENSAIKIMVEFGLMPKSRGKLPTAKTEEENTPFENFLSNG